MTSGRSLLSIRDLSVAFETKRGREQVLDRVSLDAERGTSLGLIGESGCGKSTLLKAAIGALAPNARIGGGRAIFDGEDLLRIDADALRRLRWKRIAMIPQSALNSLNPVLRIGAQIIEAAQAHSTVSDEEARAMAADALREVGIDPARMDDYPHQFSGGMRQRAIIAMALILGPDLVLADEPTTSLDVIVQDQIFRLMRRLQGELGFAMILVTHDLALVADNCSRVAVMYAGRIVEEGPTSDVIAEPLHPYTLGLKNSLPSLAEGDEPISIPGAPPDPAVAHRGCRFAPRCPFAIAVCGEVDPELIAFKGSRRSACHRSHEASQLRAAAARLETWVEKQTA
jgi:peptide/nickel transport system ATP-binding protein